MDDDDLLLNAPAQDQNGSNEDNQQNISHVANQSFIGGFGIQMSPKPHHQTKSLFDIMVPMKPEDVFTQYFQDVLKANSQQISMNVFLIGYKCD